MPPITTLIEGTTVTGVVTGVNSWGAFLDFGVAKDGLLHFSEADQDGRFMGDLNEIFSVGETLTVTVLCVDAHAGKFTLTRRAPLAVAPRSELQSQETHEEAPKVRERQPNVHEATMTSANAPAEAMAEAVPEPRSDARVEPTAAAVLSGEQRPAPAPPAPLAVVLTKQLRGRTLTLYAMPWKVR